MALVLLRSLFASITPCKGKSLHGIRSSFYLFCEGFDRAQYEEREVEELLIKAMEDVKEAEEKLEAAAIEQVANRTANLQLDGSAGAASDEAVHPADYIWLPGYTPQTLLEKEGPFVAEFFEGLWWGQIRAINKRTDELKYKKTQHASGGPSWMRGGGSGVRTELSRASPDARQDGWRTSDRGGSGGDRRFSNGASGGAPGEGAAPRRPGGFGGGSSDWRKR